jgi:hypothetical protein
MFVWFINNIYWSRTNYRQIGTSSMSTQEFLGQLLKKTTVISLELDNKISLHIPKKSNKTLDYIIKTTGSCGHQILK